MAGSFVRSCARVCAGLSVGTISVASAQTVAATTPEHSSVRVATVTVDVVNAPLESVLRQITRQAGLTAVYGDLVKKSPARVTLHVRSVAVSEAFEQALAGTKLRAAIVAEKVIFMDAGGVASAVVQGDVSGKVIDSKTQKPLRGATVTLDGTTKGVTKSLITGDDGSFRMSNIAPGSHTINVRLLGYVKATKVVAVVEGQTASVELVLDPSVSALDQVVVTGTIVATAQRAIPNAMTVITAKEIEQRGITHIEQLFRGDVPGLFAVNLGSGSPLDSVSTYSRGASTLPGLGDGYAASTPIKTYVDGIELANPAWISQIDPKSIERIEILTGPQASTIYGSNALNGVIQIFTKRGTTVRPQVTAMLMSGTIQNSLSSGLTPQHDDALQVSGTDGHWSYNVGGSWNYEGPWTPGKQTTRTAGSSGVRMQTGPITADATLRLARTQTHEMGSTLSIVTDREAMGEYTPTYSAGYPAEQHLSLDGQTLGMTLGFAPRSWWSNELVVGTDYTQMNKVINPSLIRASDTTTTLSSLTQNRYAKTSLRYATTANIPLASAVNAVVTAGADAWQTLTTLLTLSSLPALTGTLNTASTTLSRAPDHNTGAFLQAQLGVRDALFITYGLRAEWNPSYGADVSPNITPRVGVAYTRDFGMLTAKVRGSYGRATRPPPKDNKLARFATNITTIAMYGPYQSRYANPDLGPEFQKGGEGGLELYFGNRGSLVITRYDQTVDDLISQVKVDSVRSFAPIPAGNSNYSHLTADGYGIFVVSEYMNVGQVLNSGWELQGTLKGGPFSAKGTYSSTKSRMGVGAPQVRALYASSSTYAPGATFGLLPEHTWSGILTYAHAATLLSININGISSLYTSTDDIQYALQSGYTRLKTMDPRVAPLPSGYRAKNAGYTMADLNLSHRISSAIEVVGQVENLTDHYTNDEHLGYAVMGRQTKAGVRIRW